MEKGRRSRGTPDVMTAEETLVVTSVFAGEERNEQKKMKSRKFLTEPAYVRVGAGMTKNMGNFESLRVDVSLTIPCYAEETDEAFKATADRVAIYLEDEIKNYSGK